MPRRGPRPTLSTTARGYGRAHQQERQRWTPTVEAGNAHCAQPRCLEAEAGRSRWIRPGTAWHLGHTDDRTAYLGPCHATCNVIDGASKGGRAVHRRQRRTTVTGWRSNRW